MMKTGIVLIVLSLVALPVAFAAAIFGLAEVAGVALTLAKLSPLLLIPGVLLVVAGARRKGHRAGGVPTS